MGTRRGSFGKDFVVVHGKGRGKGRGVVVDLVDQAFSRIVITTPDPEEVVARLADPASA